MYVHVYDICMYACLYLWHVCMNACCNSVWNGMCTSYYVNMSKPLTYRSPSGFGLGTGLALKLFLSCFGYVYPCEYTAICGLRHMACQLLLRVIDDVTQLPQDQLRAAQTQLIILAIFMLDG
jgi:hypothetical protein